MLTTTKSERMFGKFNSRALWGFLVILLTSIAFLITSLPTYAQVDQYEDDPLGLIKGYDLTSYYSLGSDHWEIWVCEIPGGVLKFSPEYIVNLLTQKVSPYFLWLSNERYNLTFSVGGTLQLDTYTNQWECETLIRDLSSGKAEGALIVINDPEDVSYGSQGCTNVSPLTGKLERTDNHSTFPGNCRTVLIDGRSVAEPDSLPLYQASGLTLPALSTLAHELGHALYFPHSYRFAPYDHTMDILGEPDGPPPLSVGTIAINRYAAGWIDPSDV